MSGAVAYIAPNYAGNITSEHRNRPNFMATLAAALAPITALQAVFASMPLAYDLDVAVGVQLDAVGVRVGISRIIATPISGVYFAWDTVGLGWDQGVWQGKFDPTQGTTSLDDETYRLLIRAKIAANSWDGTTAAAITALNDIFSEIGLVFQIQDNQNMTMVMSISGTIPNALFSALFSGGYIPLKPLGVAVTYLVTSNSGQPVFGFDVNNEHIAGWDQGAWAVEL